MFWTVSARRVWLAIVCVAVAAAPLAHRLSAQPQAARTIELILDASGSMNAKLPDGRLKIDAARAAVQAFVGALPAGTRLAFRAYGHQSPREKHDCADTALLIPFGDAAAVKAEVVARAGALKAQGYTPITRVLETAAKDFPPPDKTPRFIVLVSDGKETCDGDPCATARAMQAAGAGLVIHTIGFDVDKAARTQLECIAKATGGTYFDAPDAERLAAVITQAAVKTATSMTIETQGPGFLAIKGAELQGHQVVDAATGKEVAVIGSLNATMKMPSGLYQVKFGESWWKSVEVKAGKTTTLEPGVVHVAGAGFKGHDIRDAETGIVHAKVSNFDETGTVMPGTYEVTFGGLTWGPFKVEAGQVVQLNPGSVTVTGLSVNDVPILTADGRQTGAVSALGSTLVLPPGNYKIQLGGQWRPFTIAEGQALTIGVK
jgi:hypothetical protein